jgi:hypothetical protein
VHGDGADCIVDAQLLLDEIARPHRDEPARDGEEIRE